MTQQKTKRKKLKNIRHKKKHKGNKYLAIYFMIIAEKTTTAGLQDKIIK